MPWISLCGVFLLISILVKREQLLSEESPRRCDPEIPSLSSAILTRKVFACNIPKSLTLNYENLSIPFVKAYCRIRVIMFRFTKPISISSWTMRPRFSACLYYARFQGFFNLNNDGVEKKRKDINEWRLNIGLLEASF